MLRGHRGASLRLFRVGIRHQASGIVGFGWSLVPGAWCSYTKTLQIKTHWRDDGLGQGACPSI